MPEPDIDPLVRALVEDRAHAINQMIMDAQLAEALFPGDQVRSFPVIKYGMSSISP